MSWRNITKRIKCWRVGQETLAVLVHGEVFTAIQEMVPLPSLGCKFFSLIHLLEILEVGFTVNMTCLFLSCELTWVIPNFSTVCTCLNTNLYGSLLSCRDLSSGQIQGILPLSVTGLTHLEKLYDLSFKFYLYISHVRILYILLYGDFLLWIF